MIDYFAVNSGDNIFSAANLDIIKRVEGRLVDFPGWSSYCLKDQGDDCAPPLSIVNCMYPVVGQTVGVSVPCVAVMPAAQCSASGKSPSSLVTKTIPKPPFDGEVYDGTGPQVASTTDQLKKLI
jgi:hypothetical protein